MDEEEEEEEEEKRAKVLSGVHCRAPKAYKQLVGES